MGAGRIRDVLVSFAEIEKSVKGVEAAFDADTTINEEERVSLAQAKIAVGHALRIIREEEEKQGPGVLSAPDNAIAARLQSLLSSSQQDKAALEALAAGGREIKFEEGFDWGWIKSGWNKLTTWDKHKLLRPRDECPESLKDQATVAFMGDWGTGMYGAPVIARQLEALKPDLIMHLGDIYYSGTMEEVIERFLDIWPRPEGAKLRALNANHEMYSGGNGYFEDILKSFNQPSSYFAIQNKHWLLIGLDTAYEDHDIEADQAEWVRHVIAAKDKNQKVILFSHHQPFSRLSDQGPKLEDRLRRELEAGSIAAWFWGHEHRCIRYARHARYGLLGRCVGHGGIPSMRTDVLHAPIASERNGCNWRHFNATGDVPESLILDGPNPHVKGKTNKYAPNGYVVLEFDGPELAERYFNADGQEVCDAGLIT